MAVGIGPLSEVRPSTELASAGGMHCKSADGAKSKRDCDAKDESEGELSNGRSFAGQETLTSAGRRSTFGQGARAANLEDYIKINTTGEAAQATAKNGSAIDNSARAESYFANVKGAIAIGEAARANNVGVALGRVASATTNAVAVGAGATSSSGHGVALGAGTLVETAGGIAIGHQARSSAPATGVGNRGDSIAIGVEASALARHSIALGYRATATGERSVALGQFSVADRDDVISVGREANGTQAAISRQIINVAAGTQRTDAANLGQLHDAIGGLKSWTQDQVNGLSRRVDNVQRQANRGIAASAALVNNMPYLPGKVTLNAGVAAYRGQSALGVGASRWSDNGRLNINAGVSASQGDAPIFRLGGGGAGRLSTRFSFALSA